MSLIKFALWGLLSLQLLCAASLDTLPFPQFHQAYFTGKFWGNSENLEHPLFALRQPLSMAQAESLLTHSKLDSAYIPALLAYNLTRDTVYAEKHLKALIEFAETGQDFYWKKKILLETLNWLKTCGQDSLRLFVYDQYRLMEKHWSKGLRKEIRQLRLARWLTAGTIQEVIEHWQQYLPVATQEQAIQLLPTVQKKIVPKALTLNVSELKSLVYFLGRAGQKEQALRLVEKYPGSKQKKYTDRLKYFGLLSDLRARAKDYPGQLRSLKARYDYEGKRAKASTLDEMIRVCMRAGKSKQADSLRDVLEKTAPAYSKIAGQLWLQAFEYEQNKEYAKARGKYQELDRRFPGHRRQTWASFRAGLVEYKAQDFEDALVQFDKAAREDQTLWPRSATLFFIALTYQKLGEDSLAKAALFRTIDDYPMGYFAWRARQELHHSYDVPVHQVPMVESFAANRQKTWEWLEETSGTVPEPDSLLPSVEALLAAGAWGWVDDLMGQKKNYSKIDLVDFGNLLMKYGYLAKAYAQGRQLLNQLDRKRMFFFPEPLVSLMFPRVYPTEVAQGVKDSGLPVEFVWALMRQESIFNDQIASPVGAMGLMQIMDYTGKDLAQLEKLDQFEARWLKNPLFAIRLGTRYLSDLYKEYGAYWWVLTNYNAGPKPTRRWIDETQGMPFDLAIEDISYWETRDYVKKVMGNYYNYLSLSGASAQKILERPWQIAKPVTDTLIVEQVEKQ